MIRAVLDTNVLVAALLSRHGAPARVVRALSDGIFDAIVCPQLLAELEGVLARPKVSARTSHDDARAYVDWLSRVALVVSDPAAVPAVSPDPDDDYLFALALAAQAQLIVSGDEHLLGVADPHPRVLSPAAFADLVDSLR